MLDGPLQDTLDEGGWQYAGHIDGFIRYELSAAPRTVWIEGSGQGATRQSAYSTTDQGGETDLVKSTHPVTVVRSEAYLPGWRRGHEIWKQGRRPISRPRRSAWSKQWISRRGASRSNGLTGLPVSPSDSWHCVRDFMCPCRVDRVPGQSRRRKRRAPL